MQLKAYAECVDQRFEELLPPPSFVPAELREAMRYSALAPGKRLRPALAMAAAAALGEITPPVVDAACAIEMVHAFSLIHDDLPAIDNDNLRRGRPTCHVVYGEAVAILAGDALFSLAFSTLADIRLDAVRVVAAMRVLTQAANRLVAGETLDVLSEGKPVDAETLVQIHTEKTGALIAASTEIGGIVGGGSPEQIAALRTYGERVGLAFQIADDILNETGTPEQLGKASGSDRERQKATYPALYGLDKSRKAALDAAAEGVAVLEAVPAKDFLVELAKFSVSRLT